jgi:hypothetical protein
MKGNHLTQKKWQNGLIAGIAILLVYLPVLDLSNYVAFLQLLHAPYFSPYFLADLCALLLALLIVCSLNRPLSALIADLRAWINVRLAPAEMRRALQDRPWRFVFPVVYFVAGALILVQSFSHNAGTNMDAFALLMLFLFPILALVWRARGDWQTLWTPIVWALVSVIPILVVLAAIHTPLGFGDVESGFRVWLLGVNPGVLSRYVAAGIPAIYYLIYQKGSARLWAATALPFAFGVVLMTGSRTTFLAVLVVTLVFLIALIKRGCGTEDGRRYLTSRVAAVVLSCVLSLPLTVFVLGIGTDLGQDETGAAHTRAAFIIRGVENYSRLVFGRFEASPASDAVTGADDKAALEDLSRLSSGRVELWTAYLKSITLSGHSVGESPLFAGAGAYPNAHNAPLTIGFRCGAIAGILYLLLILLSAWYVIRRVFARGTLRSMELFPCLLIAFYFFYPLLDPPLFPFDELPVLLFFLAVGFPLFGQRPLRSPEHTG